MASGKSLKTFEFIFHFEKLENRIYSSEQAFEFKIIIYVRFQVTVMTLFEAAMTLCLLDQCSQQLYKTCQVHSSKSNMNQHA